MEKRKIGEIQTVIDGWKNAVNNKKLLKVWREVPFRFNDVLTKNLKEGCLGGV